MSSASYPLFANFFQLGYATSDLDRAMLALRESHGVNAFKVMRDVDGSGDMKVHIALACVGDLMIELIEPCGGDDSFYRDLLPPGEFAIRHHHMGYRVHGESHWQSLQDTIKRNGYAIATSGDVPGLLRFAYVDNRKELGHYQEYILTTEAGAAAFFGDVPR
jgi:hypothetical protein